MSLIILPPWEVIFSQRGGTPAIRPFSPVFMPDADWPISPKMSI